MVLHFFLDITGNAPIMDWTGTVLNMEAQVSHPTDNRDGYYTTFDICRIFDMKRGRIKNWIEQEFIKPMHQVTDKRGKVSYFTKEQLYSIYLFRSLVDAGIKRDYAGTWVKAFENLKKKAKHDVNFVVVDISGTNYSSAIQRITVADNVVIEPTDKATSSLVVNLKRVVEKVDSYLK
jgi:hypothetical protein